MPVLPPVAAHAQPLGVGPFHAHAHDIPCARDVGDQDQVEVTETVNCESDSASLSAGHPAKTKKIIIIIKKMGYVTVKTCPNSALRFEGNF